MRDAFRGKKAFVLFGFKGEDGRMDGWMDGRMDEWIERRISIAIPGLRWITFTLFIHSFIRSFVRSFVSIHSSITWLVPYPCCEFFDCDRVSLWERPSHWVESSNPDDWRKKRQDEVFMAVKSHKHSPLPSMTFSTSPTSTSIIITTATTHHHHSRRRHHHHHHRRRRRRRHHYYLHHIHRQSNHV